MESSDLNYSHQHVRAATFTTWPLTSPNVNDMVQAGFIYKGIVSTRFPQHSFKTLKFNIQPEAFTCCYSNHSV